MGEQEGTTRRQFLTRLGAAGAALGLPAIGRVPASAIEPQATAGGAGVPVSPGLFGRMFPGIAPFASASSGVRAALMEVGAKAGIMDAADDMAAGPASLLPGGSDDGNSGNDPDNPALSCGLSFFAQFLDHDITFDQTSLLGVPKDPLVSPNSRSPALDLDSVFAGGPHMNPRYYQGAGPLLTVGSGGDFEDLPRSATHRAVIPDRRNDQTVMVAGMHCAHSLFYNQVVADLPHLNLGYLPRSLRNGIGTPYGQYLAARQVTLLHYQWLVVNELLPAICGPSVVQNVLANGNRFYFPPQGDGFMPIEFSAAAYRFGHSTIRPAYRANFTGGGGSGPFEGPLFDPSAPSFNTPYDRNDLMGGYPAPRRYIGWQSFVDAGDGLVIPSKRVDTKITTALFDLPLPAIPPDTQGSPTVLPQRNLLRQLTWTLPSGQAVATAMGLPALVTADLADIAAVYRPFGSSTPLWYYLLAESSVVTKGQSLGPTAARIVVETILGLLRVDPNSYLTRYLGFQPSLGADFNHGSTGYTLASFLHYAGVLDAGVYR